MQDINVKCTAVVLFVQQLTYLSIIWPWGKKGQKNGKIIPGSFAFLCKQIKEKIHEKKKTKYFTIYFKIVAYFSPRNSLSFSLPFKKFILVKEMRNSAKNVWEIRKKFLAQFCIF